MEETKPGGASSVSAPVPPKVDLRVYELFREKIVEDNLINHRMTWFIYIQALLLALWGGIFTQHLLDEACKAHDRRIAIVLSVVSGFGIFFAVGNFLSIRAAKQEISNVQDKYKNDYPQIYSNKKLPFSGTRGRHFWGHIVDMGSAAFLSLMWGYLTRGMDGDIVLTLLKADTALNYSRKPSLLLGRRATKFDRAYLSGAAT